MKKTYSYEENFVDYDNLQEGAKKEVEAAIDAWKAAGKPDFADRINDIIMDDYVLLTPYNNNGKLSFFAYCYDAGEDIMEEFKKGAEELPEIIEVDLSKMGVENPDDEDKMVYGDYFVHTNIDF